MTKPLRIGNRVTLPDGDTGTVVRIRPVKVNGVVLETNVHILHPERTLGRGPWLYTLEQVSR